jgi:hypothetical protein
MPSSTVSAASPLVDRRTALARAKARLDRLTLYTVPVRISGIRLVVAPDFFRLPLVRRVDGLALWRRTIVLRRPPRDRDDLLVHELCHIWQMQHHPIRMPASYLRFGYRDNPFEREAREAGRSPVSVTER